MNTTLDFDVDKSEVKIKNDDGTWTTLGKLSDFHIDKDWFNINSDWYKGPKWDDDLADAMRYCMGIWDEEERNDNMNIVDLYRMRKREQINNKYKELIDKEYNELDVVKEYKELINTFDINMKQLADKYNNNDTQPLVKTAYKNDYSYELSMYLEEEIRSKYNDVIEKELKELERLIEEVKAMLYLSDDKDYQLEVLKNYEIVDKKGKLNI